MDLKISIPPYSKETGIHLHWEEGFTINTFAGDGNIRISGNKEGLRSLANHLLNLSQENVPSGTHIHLDELNSLEENSVELILERID